MAETLRLPEPQFGVRCCGSSLSQHPEMGRTLVTRAGGLIALKSDEGTNATPMSGRWVSVRHLNSEQERGKLEESR